MTIVVDGRTDYDKLIELLGLPEHTHLDFKAKVDLTVTEDKVKFVNDAVSMSNRPPCGYILLGVDDGGTPRGDAPGIQVCGATWLVCSPRMRG